MEPRTLCMRRARLRVRMALSSSTETISILWRRAVRCGCPKGPRSSDSHGTACFGDGLIAPDRLASFAVIDAPDGWLRRIVEKPDAAWLAAAGAGFLVSMNCWRFDREIFDVIPTLPLSPRGELELPSAAQALVDRGVRFRVIPSDEGVLDLSRRADVVALEERLAGREVQL